MRQAVRRRAWTALLLTGALLASAPAVMASAQTPIDPSIPTPTLPGATGCGSDAPGWSYGSEFAVGVPASTVNGVNYQAAIHVWDVDGSQRADSLAPWLGSGASVADVYSPVNFQNGHTYDWYAQTYDGTGYSEPTAACSFKVDTSVRGPDGVPAHRSRPAQRHHLGRLAVPPGQLTTTPDPTGPRSGPARLAPSSYAGRFSVRVTGEARRHARAHLEWLLTSWSAGTGEPRVAA